MKKYKYMIVNPKGKKLYFETLEYAMYKWISLYWNNDLDYFDYMELQEKTLFILLG